MRSAKAGVVAGIILPLVVQGQSTRPAGEPPQYFTARSVPEDLLNQRPRQSLILPSEPGEAGEDLTQLSSGAVAKLPPDAHRLPDGYIIASREARIDPQGDWYVAHLARVPGLPDAPPLRILPNKRLMMIEAIHQATGKPPTLLVTGRVTEFQGANYLLVESLAELSSGSGLRAGGPGASAGSGADDRGAVPSSAGPGGGAATQPGAAREPSAEEIIKQLMENKPLRAVVLPEQVPAVPTASAPAAGGPLPGPTGPEVVRWPEETMLVDRAGRVVPGERWWMLAFEDHGKNPSTAPIRLLPNRQLEDAIATSGGGTRAVVFVVSGEVTEYRGGNHLLLRKVLIRRELGNLR